MSKSQRQAASSELTTLEQIDKLATRLRDSAKRGQGANVEAIDKFDAAKEVLQSIAQLEVVHRRLEEELPVLEQGATLQFMSLASSISELCSARSWRIQGEWPSYIVERGVAIEVDEARRTVNVGGRRVPTTARAIEEALKPLVETLIPRDFDAGEFITGLAAVYDQLREGGASVELSILDIYRSFVTRSQTLRFWRDATAGRFTSIGQDQFRARFSFAMERTAGRAADNRLIRLLPALNPDDAIFMFLPGESRFAYVGRIAFSPEKQP